MKTKEVMPFWMGRKERGLFVCISDRPKTNSRNVFALSFRPVTSVPTARSPLQLIIEPAQI